MAKDELREFKPDGYTPTEQEIAEMEEAYRLWEEELKEAIASGDQARIDQAYEDGK